MGLLDRSTSFKHDPNKLVGFGKFKTQLWREVPDHYLGYIIVNFGTDELAYKHAIAEKDRRGGGRDPYKHLDKD